MDALHFASPWFLAGLATLAAPFLLLLTRPKTFNVIPFSSIRFLRAVTKKASKVIEWRRLLLLAVRLLTLFALATAFSLPFIQERANFFHRAQSHLIFLLDNSYSMDYREEGPSLFEKSKQIVEHLAKDSGKGKPLFSLYTFNARVEPLAVKVKKDPFLSELNKAKVSERGTSYAELLDELERKISQKNPQNSTEVFILSDFSIREPGLQKEFVSFVRSACKGCRVQLIPVQPREYRNFSLEDVGLPPPFLLAGAPEEIQVSYRAWGMKGKVVQVSGWVDGTEIDSQTVTLSEAGKGVLTFRHTFPAPGSYTLRFKSSDDALSIDNTLYRFVVVREPLRVLFMEDRDYKYPFESPSFYLAQVFESAGSGATGQAWIESVRTQLSDFSRLNPDRYDLIILSDISRLDSASSSKLRDYLAAGGSLLFAAGKKLEEEGHFKSPPLNQLLGGTLGEIKKTESSSRPLRLEHIHYSHPLFRVFEEGKKGDLNTVRFSKFFTFLSQEKADCEILLEFDSGSPALLEIKKGKGRLLVWTSSLNLDWTDFPRSPLYVPFVLELLKYTTLKGALQTTGLRVGEKLMLDPSSTASRSLTLRTPTGESLALYGGPKSSPQSVEVEKAGIYEWTEFFQGVPEKRGVAVNVDMAESKPAYLPFQNPQASREGASSQVFRNRLHTERFFYRSLVTTVLFLLLIEVLLANRFYKPRWV